MTRSRILGTPPGGPLGLGILDKITDWFGGGLGDLWDRLINEINKKIGK